MIEHLVGARNEIVGVVAECRHGAGKTKTYGYTCRQPHGGPNIRDKLATLSLWVRLPIISSLILLGNSEVAMWYALLYQRLNSVPLWTWLGQSRQSNLLVFVNVLLLVLSLWLLASSTMACTVARVVELGHLSTRKWGPGKTLVAWAPPPMHILFFLLLAGHMVAFTFGEWQQYTVRKAETLQFSSRFSPLTVADFSRSVCLAKGPLCGSTVSHQADLQIAGGKATISELQPLRLPNGEWLFLLPP